MIFYRTVDNKLHNAGEVPNVGFPLNDPSYIPDEYLGKQNFVILRTCFGLGDWGIISAFPKKLKEKYPNCKVWIPSAKLLKELFGHLESNWNSWDDPFKVVNTIFDNNPYVDGFIDEFVGEVFNDHYKLYETPKEDIPLLEQILKFWQFDNFDGIEPEMYWSDSEKELGDKIIKEHTDGNFGTLLIANRYKKDSIDLIQNKLDEYDLPIFYWTSEKDSGLKFKKALDLRHIDMRIQMYIKSKATFNVGNQCGVNDTISNYAPTFSIAKNKLKSNIVRCQNYLYKEVDLVLNELPDKWEVKTTTSKLWKEGLYNFIKYQNIKSVLEIGTSLGHTTYFVAHFVDKVTTLEFDSSRVSKAKKLSEKHNNINFVNASSYDDWNFDYHDLVIIDCIHEYKYIKSDIENAINLGTKYIAFDDYGLFPELKLAIDEAIDSGRIEMIQKIGYPKGTHFHMSKSTNTTSDKILADSEGLICRVI
jgi:hypothetical protein